MKFQGKLASLQQVSRLNSQDNFQTCCADLYLVRFLASFMGFHVFLGILQDFADLLEKYLKFAAPPPLEISEALYELHLKNQG